MKLSIFLIASMSLLAFKSSTVSLQTENLEFVCMKKQVASNQCHYNFKMDGAKFRYVDIGCRFKKDDVIEKVKEGSLGLAKEWKISCPEPKEKKEGEGY